MKSMKIWNAFKKQKPQNNLSFFQVIYQKDMVFGVTAESVNEAEELVCEEIFHNQTIPGLPTIEVLNIDQVKNKFTKVSLKKLKQKGIWHPS